MTHSARPKVWPRQSGADIAKIVMRDPQLVQALRQRRKLACDPAQQT